MDNTTKNELLEYKDSDRSNWSFSIPEFVMFYEPTIVDDLKKTFENDKRVI